MRCPQVCFLYVCRCRVGGVELRIVGRRLAVEKAEANTGDSNALAVPTLPASAEPELYELHVSVKDSGMGISPSQLPLLFRTFSQVQHSSGEYGGTGLGLVISKVSSHKRAACAPVVLCCTNCY